MLKSERIERDIYKPGTCLPMYFFQFETFLPNFIFDQIWIPFSDEVFYFLTAGWAGVPEKKSHYKYPDKKRNKAFDCFSK